MGDGGEGSVAKFSCDNGFGLKGEQFLLCGADGEWDFPPPTCESKLTQSMANSFQGFQDYIDCIWGGGGHRNYPLIKDCLYNHVLGWLHELIKRSYV